MVTKLKNKPKVVKNETPDNDNNDSTTSCKLK